MKHRPARSLARRALVLLGLALPAWARALDFDFRPPAGPDDAAAAALMRDLALRIVPVYQDADPDAFLANMAALQNVGGSWRAAVASSKSLRTRVQDKPFDALAVRALIGAIYAQARLLEESERIGFAAAYTRSFHELVAPLSHAQAGAVIASLTAPLAQFREPVRRAFDRWRAQGRLPQDQALALVRDWLAYDTRRSIAALLPELVAADDGRRYVTQDTLGIPVRPGVLIHARLVRPRDIQTPLPTLLRFTIDAAEHDARHSAMRGYVGLTAYVRGRRPDGQGTAWPFVHDAEDAVAVIAWIARQPWSDGRVAMLGDGYSGYAAWAAAARRPAALKAIATLAPMAPGVDFPMAGQIYRNAMVRWAQRHAGPALVPARAGVRPDDAGWPARDARWYRGDQPYWNIDRVLLGQRSPLIRTWLTHPSHDRYWRKFLPSPRQFAQIDIPVLSMAGYFGDTAGALYYHDMQLRHRPQADQTLLLGPYDAASMRAGPAAQLRGYALDPVARVDLRALRAQWLDHVMQGTPKPALLRAPVNYQVMGANAWQHQPQLASPQRSRLRLHLTGRQRAGAYQLSLAPATGVGQAQLQVDLADRRDAPATAPDALRLAQLPLRQSIQFASEPLPQDTLIDGRLHGAFDITPSRQDLDLVVSLYAQMADGAYQLLFEPYDFRASYAGQRQQRRLLQAGMRQLLAFSTERVTACRLPAGSRIVLLIGIQQRPDRQINYGSGKDVNAETIADARGPLRVRWHAPSHIEIQTGAP